MRGLTGRHSGVVYLVVYSRVFSALCNDMGSEHVTLLRHTEVVIKVLTHFPSEKLELFSVCINQDNTQVFPSLYDFFVCK
jgi:hypothetical protein